MGFNYNFLLVGQDPQRLESITSTLKQDFSNCDLHTARDPQDAQDYCRANVYDLIVTDTAGINVNELGVMVRELNNDNLHTGILVVGTPEQPIDNLSHIMLAQDQLEGSDYLQMVNTLITLKP